MVNTTVDTLLVKIKADTKQLESELNKIQRTTAQTSGRMADSFKKFDASLGKAIKRTALVGGAIAGAFGAVAIKKIVDVGSEVENLQVRFRSMFGSIEEGNKAFDNMATFASKVPFSLQEIQRGSGSLAAVANDADHLSKLLQITGNAAALSGLGFAEASMQIQRAFSAGIASAEMFKERGLAGMLGFEKGASVSVEETVRVFEEAFTGDGKFAKMTDELAQTLTGTLSMIGDKIFSFQRLISDEKFFGTVKQQFDDLNRFLEDNKESIDELGKSIGIGLAEAIQKAVEGLIFINENLEEFKTLMKAIGGLVAIKILKDLFVALAKLGKNAGLLALLAVMPKQLKIAVGGAVALGLAIKGVQTAMGDADKEGRQFLTTINKINEEIRTQGVPSFMDTKSPKSPVEAMLAPNRGLEGEPSKLVDTFNAEMRSMDNQIALSKIRNEDEKEFQQLLIQTGITQTDMVAQLREKFDVMKEIESVQEKNNDIMSDAESIIEGNKTEQEKLNEQILIFEEALNNVAEEDVPKVQEALVILKEELKQLDPLMQEITQIFDRASASISQAIADSITDGKNLMESLGNITKQVVNQMIAEFLRLKVIGPLMSNIFGGAMGGMGGSRGGGGGFNPLSLLGPLFSFGGLALAPATGGASAPIGGLAGSLAAGTTGGLGNLGGTSSFMMAGRAGGGTVSPSRAVMVGERGPEIFVPNSGGKIVPNHNMKSLGGQETVINQNINITTGVSQTVRAEVLNMLPAIKQETLQAVADSRLRGGTFGAAFTR